VTRESVSNHTDSEDVLGILKKLTESA
jgi:hypothetical protein